MSDEYNVLLSFRCLSAVAKTKILIKSHWRKSLKKMTGYLMRPTSRSPKTTHFVGTDILIYTVCVCVCVCMAVFVHACVPMHERGAFLSVESVSLDEKSEQAFVLA